MSCNFPSLNIVICIYVVCQGRIWRDHTTNRESRRWHNWKKLCSII